MAKVFQENIVLHGPFKGRRRHSSRGVKERVTIETKSEMLLHVFDDRVLGAKPANAIKEAFKLSILAIQEEVTPETLARRERAIRDGGSTWYQRRYGATLTKKGKEAFAAGTLHDGGEGLTRKGGTGETPPSQGARRFANDSGRLAHKLTVRENKSEQSWTTNVPANRLNREMFGRGFDAFLERLYQLAPILGDADRLLRFPGVEAAIDESIDDLIMKAENESKLKLLEMKAARKAALVAAGRLVIAVGRPG